jgi:hypothetical protein
MAAGPDTREPRVDGSGSNGRGATIGRIAASFAMLLLVIAAVLWMMLHRPGATPTTQLQTLTGSGSLPSAGPAPSSVPTPTGIPVPDVVGKTQADAEVSLRSASLRAATSRRSAGVPVGEVISQIPAAGTIVAEGTLVNLVISTGLTGVTSGGHGPYVPSALGQSRSDGESTLRNAGYGVSVTYAPSTSTPSGRVFYQDPGAGETASHGTVVSMWVSTGPARFPYKRPPIP